MPAATESVIDQMRSSASDRSRGAETRDAARWRSHESAAPPQAAGAQSKQPTTVPYGTARWLTLAHIHAQR